MRHFEFVGEDSNRKSNRASKFWEIVRDGNTLTIRFGPIGAKGQTTVKDFSSAGDAEKAEAKAVAEKLKKGYIETAPSKSSDVKAKPKKAKVGTPFDTQCEIMSDLWLNYRTEEAFIPLFELFDMGFPLAFAYNQGMVTLNPVAKSFIQMTWAGTYEAFGHEEDTGFESVDDLASD